MKKRKMIIRKLPEVGTKLFGICKKKQYTAKIVRDDKYTKGRLIELDGKKYPTMSTAAKVITKCSINGWKFWKIVQ